jgi:aerobic-type carbon monoxide dehydrogenase small subunit (CoxS/CutS family)
MKRMIRFELNGKEVTVNTDDERTLLWALRIDFDLTGTKYGCGEALCGACTVIVDGKAVHSCKTRLKSVEGKKIVTIEGLARDGKLHPLQQAFIDHGAFQCGYCTSGMLLTAFGFLHENPKPSRNEIIAHMERNLCRCGAQGRIIDAIESVSGRGTIQS